MPNEEVKEVNVERVSQTTCHLFLTNGIKSTTKEMLVRESGVSRSTVDRYFPSEVSYVSYVAMWTLLFMTPTVFVIGAECRALFHQNSVNDTADERLYEIVGPLLCLTKVFKRGIAGGI